MKTINSDEEAFRGILDAMYDTYKKKNQDYGNSFHELFVEDGPIVGKIHISEKYKRFVQLLTSGKNMVENEHIEDSLLDMANYCILTLIEMWKREGRLENKE